MLGRTGAPIWMPRANLRTQLESGAPHLTPLHQLRPPDWGLCSTPRPPPPSKLGNALRVSAFPVPTPGRAQETGVEPLLKVHRRLPQHQALLGDTLPTHTRELLIRKQDPPRQWGFRAAQLSLPLPSTHSQLLKTSLNGLLSAKQAWAPGSHRQQSSAAALQAGEVTQVKLH